MILKKLSKIFTVIAFVLVFFAFADISSAQNLSNWKDVLEKGGGPDGAGYTTDAVSPEPFIALVIKTLLSLLGIIFLVLMIYAGMLWMTARGSNEQVGKAKEMIIAAIIGLIIVLLSYAISIFVIDALTESTLTL